MGLGKPGLVNALGSRQAWAVETREVGDSRICRIFLSARYVVRAPCTYGGRDIGFGNLEKNTQHALRECYSANSQE